MFFGQMNEKIESKEWEKRRDPERKLQRTV